MARQVSERRETLLFLKGLNFKNLINSAGSKLFADKHFDCQFYSSKILEEIYQNLKNISNYKLGICDDLLYEDYFKMYLYNDYIKNLTQDQKQKTMEEVVKRLQTFTESKYEFSFKFDERERICINLPYSL